MSYEMKKWVFELFFSLLILISLIPTSNIREDVSPLFDFGMTIWRRGDSSQTGVITVYLVNEGEKHYKYDNNKFHETIQHQKKLV